MLKDMLHVRATGRKLLAREPRAYKTLELRPPIVPEERGIDEEYELSLDIRCRFRSNSASHKACLNDAETYLAHVLYDDIIADVHKLKALSTDAESYEILSNMLNKMLNK